MTTLWQQHVDRWKDCQLCPLGAVRTRIVLARGKVPCDVLLLGEAPGSSEDLIGQPFVGPAGHLLDRIVAQALSPEVRCAFTNLVACFPRDEKATGENEPPDRAIKSCASRLREFVDLAAPRLIVCVGLLAEKWCNPALKTGALYGSRIPQVAITHPAAILRANIAQQGLAIQRCVVRISNAMATETT